MLFNSLQFLVFFPIVTLLYFLIPQRWRWLHLLIASCVFYMMAIPQYILILFFTIIIDYCAGILIEKAEGRRRKLFLFMSIVANLGVLSFFKYFNFFTENVNEILSLLHLQVHEISYLHIILPIGLSFHTFQAMSYTIEVYRGNQKAERHFGIYALYVMFYPQLVAGPIERPQNLLHQFREEHTFSSQNLIDGLRLMLWGLFKKAVIADRLLLYINIVYHDPGRYHFLNLILAAFFFVIEVYCDFSGYSDMAIGAARVMGFELMTNFDRPLMSRSLTELWRKWHISLTTWFRDYVYIPLGGNRISKWRIYFNIMLMFVLSGFWHGAAWTYGLWGALHGLGMIYEMHTRELRKKITAVIPSLIYTPFTIILTVTYFSLVTIFFRSASVREALMIVKHIFTGYHQQAFQTVLTSFDNNKVQFGGASMAVAMIMILIMFVTENRMSVKMDNLNSRPALDVLFCSVILIFVIVLGVFHHNSFIYFQF